MSRHLLVTVALPDRPGALGAAASRIGGLGANITDITIVHGEQTIDHFHLDLPDQPDHIDIVSLLIGELGQVDGIEVLHWSTVDRCGCTAPG